MIRLLLLFPLYCFEFWEGKIERDRERVTKDVRESKFWMERRMGRETHSQKQNFGVWGREVSLSFRQKEVREKKKHREWKSEKESEGERKENRVDLITFASMTLEGEKKFVRWFFSLSRRHSLRSISSFPSLSCLSSFLFLSLFLLLSLVLLSLFSPFSLQLTAKKNYLEEPGNESSFFTLSSLSPISSSPSSSRGWNERGCNLASNSPHSLSLLFSSLSLSSLFLLPTGNYFWFFRPSDDPHPFIRLITQKSRWKKKREEKRGREIKFLDEEAFLSLKICWCCYSSCFSLSLSLAVPSQNNGSLSHPSNSIISSTFPLFQVFSLSEISSLLSFLHFP